MQPQERDLASLWDMREGAGLIASFLRGVTYLDYENNLMLRSAIERQLEIINHKSTIINLMELIPVRHGGIIPGDLVEFAVMAGDAD